MRHLLVLLLSSLIPITGCASYSATSVPIPKGSDMLVWQSQDGLAVGAEPYVAKITEARVLRRAIEARDDRAHLGMVGCDAVANEAVRGR